MADPETPKRDESAQTTPEEAPRKRRRRGYRGYPNKPGTPGDVHTGSGFGGAGALNTGGAPSGSGLISEKTREDAEEE